MTLERCLELTGEIAALIDTIGKANHCEDASYMVELELINHELTCLLIDANQLTEDR